MDMTGMIGSWIIGIYRWMLEHLFVINIVFSVLIIFFSEAESYYGMGLAFTA